MRFASSLPFIRGLTSFYVPRDWLAFGVTFVVVLTKYVSTLSPTVNMEDGGELVVAADYLGVPHPPGYPIWTLVTWFFQWVFGGVTFRGYPNPAWAAALASAFFGALGCAILAMLISRSLRPFVRGLRREAFVIRPRMLAWGTGAMLGIVLYLAFSVGDVSIPLFGGDPIEFFAIKIVSGLMLATFAVLGLARYFGFLGWASPVERLLPDLESLGAAFYGMILTTVVWFVAWTMLLDPAPYEVVAVTMAVLILASIWFLGMDVLIRKAARVKRGYRDFVRSGADVILGVGGGMLFAFSPLLWSQSVIAEVYSLNAFFVCLILALCFQFIFRPSKTVLYVTTFVFALGLTNHQSLAFFAMFLLASLAAARERRLFKDALILMAFALIGLAVFKLNQDIYQKDDGALAAFKRVIGYGVIALALLANLRGGFLTSWKPLSAMALLGVLGLGFHAFMPLASEQNPPMNWGYARVKDGLMQVLLRQQYSGFTVTENTKKIRETMTKPFPDELVAQQPNRDLQNAVISQHELDRTFFPRQLAAYFTDFASKFSIANQFSWPVPIDKAHYGTGKPPPHEWIIPVALLGILPLTMFFRLSARMRGWNHCLLVAMFFLTVVFLIIQWPDLSKNDLFVKRVQYIQSHAVFSLWMAYGAAVLILLVYAWVPSKLFWRVASCVVASVFVLMPLTRDTFDYKHIEYLGASDLSKSDFGWQFGKYSLKGANGILLDELSHHRNPDCELTEWSWAYLEARQFSQEQIDAIRLLNLQPAPRKAFRKSLRTLKDVLDTAQMRQLEHAAMIGAFRKLSPNEQAAKLVFLHAPLPDWDYPREMSQNAIFFGGTDPGRFVPEYMIHSAEVRPDVSLITQNALAQVMYLKTMRDLYGEKIWLPTLFDRQLAMREYENTMLLYDLNRYRLYLARGILGSYEVMRFNEPLSRMMFEENKARHDFYVEVSQTIPWMHPYMRPNGLILALEAEHVTLSDEDIRKDIEFWEWMLDNLLERYLPQDQRTNRLARDAVARKSFSNFRRSMAAVYWDHGFPEASEKTLLQALDLSPGSPAATQELMLVYARQHRFQEAQEIVMSFLEIEREGPLVERFKTDIVRVLRISTALEANKKLYDKGIREGNLMESLVVGHVSLADYAAAAEIAREAFGLKEMDPTSHFNITQHIKMVEDKELIRYGLMTLMEKAPHEVLPSIELAVIALTEGDRSELVRLLAMIEAKGFMGLLQRDIRFRELERRFPGLARFLRARPQQRPPIVPPLPPLPAQGGVGQP